LATELGKDLTPEMKKNLFGNAYLNMLWSCPSDPRFCYWVHLPDCYYDELNPQYSLMVIIHGTGCAVEKYVAEGIAWADEHKVALLAPLFPSGMTDPDDFNAYKLLSCDGIRYDNILLSMVEDMEKRYPGVDGSQFFMFGHSGGGQFVNRFLFAHPEKLKGASIGAPGRPTFLNFEENYFWGVKDFASIFGSPVDLKAVRKVPVQITVGELDTMFIGESPYGTCRVDRMKSLQNNLRDHGVYVELEILPGLAHPGGEKERVATAQHFFQKYL